MRRRSRSAALGHRGVLLGGAALFALFSLLTSPGCQSGGDSAVDAGATIDASADGSFVDGGRDAAPRPDAMTEPLWVPVQNLPALVEGCEVYRATRPNDVLRIRWVACGDGCQQLDLGPDWGVRDQGLHRDGVATFYAFRSQPRHPDRADQPSITTTVIATVERSTFAAQVRDLPFLASFCGYGVDLAGSSIVVNTFFDAHDAPQRIRRVFVTDPITPRWPLPHLFEVTLNPGSGLHSPAASDALVAYQNQPNERVLLADRATGEWRYLSDLEPGYDGNPQNLTAVGRDLFYEVWASRQLSVAHASLDSDAELFIALPVEERADVFGFETDGVDMVWLQGYGRECSYGCPDDHDRLEVWTSPYATRPEDLRPRRVGEIPLRARGGYEIGAGRYATMDFVPGTTDQFEMLVFELATGRVARFRLPDGWLPLDPIDLHETELLVYARHVDEPRRTLFRFELASLQFE